MYIAAQIIGIVAMGTNIISYQFKSRKMLLFFQFLGSALFAVNMFMLDATMGGILNILGVARALTYINKDKIKIPLIYVNSAFVLAYVSCYVLLFTVFGTKPTAINMISEILPVLGMSIMTFALAGDDAKKIRLCGFINSPCWLIYNCFNFAIGGILCEAFSLISITSAFIRIDIMGKKEQTV